MSHLHNSDQLKYHEAWKAPFDSAFQSLVLLGSSPRSSARVMLPPCQACSITLFTMVMELQTLQSLDELDQALAKPRERPHSCLDLSSRACGYLLIVEQITTDITIGTKNILPFETFLRGD